MKFKTQFYSLCVITVALTLLESCSPARRSQVASTPLNPHSALLDQNLASISSAGTDAYVYQNSYTGTGVAQTFSCEPGYSIASATTTAISGAGSCLTYINGGTVTYGGCVGKYFLQAVCVKAKASVLSSTDIANETTTLPGLALSATDIEVPSGALSCIPGISGNTVNHGGCGLTAGQTGYRFQAVSATVVDTKTFIDSYPGFDGVNERLMSCPSGYKAVSATEITTSGALQCIPWISDDKVYYGGCAPTPEGDYHLTAVCAKISGTGASASAPTSATYTIPNTCKPPRHYRFTVPVGQEPHLRCNADATVSIIRMPIKDRGHALARGVMILGNNSPNIHFWNSYIFVGNPEISYGVGDDLCKWHHTDQKTVMGYGNLADESSAFVDWKAYAGAECTPGADTGMVVYSGSYLDVWVEDPSDGCVKKDVGLVSSYDTFSAPSNTPAVNAVFPASGYVYYPWTNSMTQLTEISVPPTSARSHIDVFGTVEGSPFSTDPRYTYACDTPASTLVAQVKSDTLGNVAQTQGIVPTIGGMGHLVLSPAPSSSLSYDARSMRSFSLWVGSNLSADVPVTTDGCCGDGKIGFVKSP